MEPGAIVDPADYERRQLAGVAALPRQHFAGPAFVHAFKQIETKVLLVRPDHVKPAVTVDIDESDAAIPALCVNQLGSHGKVKWQVRPGARRLIPPLHLPRGTSQGDYLEVSAALDIDQAHFRL